MNSMDSMYTVLLEDVNRTFNINSHIFHIYAGSFESAIGAMVIKRPDLNVKNINTITNTDTNEMLVHENGEWVKTDRYTYMDELVSKLPKK